MLSVLPLQLYYCQNIKKGEVTKKVQIRDFNEQRHNRTGPLSPALRVCQGGRLKLQRVPRVAGLILDCDDDLVEAVSVNTRFTGSRPLTWKINQGEKWKETKQIHDLRLTMNIFQFFFSVFNYMGIVRIN